MRNGDGCCPGKKLKSLSTEVVERKRWRGRQCRRGKRSCVDMREDKEVRKGGHKVRG